MAIENISAYCQAAEELSTHCNIIAGVSVGGDILLSIIRENVFLSLLIGTLLVIMFGFITLLARDWRRK